MDAHVKAIPVNSLVRFVRNELSPEQLSRVMAQLPAGYPQYFTGQLLATEQIPLAPVNLFTALAADAKGETVERFGIRSGRFSAEQGLKSVYRFIMIMMSVETVLKKAPFMWSRVYDRGILTVDSTASTARIHLNDFPSHEACCARITGWFQQIGETAGAKQLVTTHTECKAKGGAECLWQFRWQ